MVQLNSFHNLHSKILAILFILFFVPKSLCGQQYSDSIIATFYNKTLAYLFPDTSISNEQKKYGKVTILIDCPADKLIKNSGKNIFKYYPFNTQIKMALNWPYIFNNGRNIYTLTNFHFGTDTVDININAFVIRKRPFGKIRELWLCKGPYGYIPDCRFIFNKVTMQWDCLTSVEIWNAKKKA